MAAEEVGRGQPEGKAATPNRMAAGKWKNGKT